VDSFSFPGRGAVAGLATALLALVLLLPACSDDPILGPDDGETEGGGSYSVIKRLAPADTAASDTSATHVPLPPSPAHNPERF
jgi:hypothetical protein